jgi:putative redox protein
MAEVVSRWVEGVQFVHTGTGGHSIVTDGLAGGPGQGHGFKPSELLLASVSGCTGYDVAEILAKQRQKLTGLTVTVRSTQAADPPWIFEKMVVEYAFRGKGLNETLVKRAIELSETKYCSVMATISPRVEITTSFVIEEA